MHNITKNKLEKLKKVSDNNQIISALAIDQRGSLSKMLGSNKNEEDTNKSLREFKVIISKVLTPYSSSILLDPEYGLDASKVKNSDSGLLLAYEKTGYDSSEVGRLPDLISDFSVKRLKENGADAIKFLIYYDVDENIKINDVKQAFIERIGSECLAEELPFFLEILTYDSSINNEKGIEYAKVKPRKVNEAMKIFSNPRFNVDVLKVEVPVNMNYVEGFNSQNDFVFTKEEAMKFFKEQDESTDLPYIYLSAGVSIELFIETLKLAKESGANFNGVLCGRATWKDAVSEYSENGFQAAEKWLSEKGIENIIKLNEAIKKYATSWSSKIDVIK